MGNGVRWEIGAAEGEIFELKEVGLVRENHAIEMEEHTAQHPRTSRLFQSLRGLGATEDMAWAMRRMRVSGSLSSCKRSVPRPWRREDLYGAFMSRRTHISSRPGFARYSKRSVNRGIGSWGSRSVRSGAMCFQSQSMIFSSLPKHRFRVASWSKGECLLKLPKLGAENLRAREPRLRPW